MKRRRYNITGVSVLLLVALIGTGCVGRFAAFNKLSDWNQKAHDNKYVNEVIFLALNIIPVYPIALLADAIVINSIEFWTGDNIILSEGETQKVVEAGKDKVIQTFYQTDDLKKVVIEYYHENQLVKTVRLSQHIESPTFQEVVTDANGIVDQYVIQPEASKIMVSHISHQEKIHNSNVITGTELASLSEQVSKLIDSPEIQLASIHE